MPPHVPYGLHGLPSRLWPTSEVGTPMRCSYVVSMRWMVIWIWSTRRGLNPSSIKLPRLWSPWESSPSRKSPHGRVGNRTRDLMISSQKLWLLDHNMWSRTAHCTLKSCRCTAGYYTLNTRALSGSHSEVLAVWVAPVRVCLIVSTSLSIHACWGDTHPKPANNLRVK
jgi:hypothetical protein